MISYYALKVAPLTELKVQKILHQREHPALVPVQMTNVVRPANGRIVKRERPVLPSYVFVGLEDVGQIREERDWINKREKRPVVFGPVGFGRPAIMTPSDVAWLLSISHELDNPVTVEAFAVGQDVRIKVGHLYEGRIGKITELKGKDKQRAKIFLHILGGMRVVEVATAALESAA